MNLFTSKIEKAKIDIEQLGTKDIKHTRGSTLYHHLVRVQEILLSWGVEEAVQVAALYHSVYSTEYFTKVTLTTNARSDMQSKLGNAAEHIVYLFSILDRDTVIFDEKNNVITFKNYITKELVTCDYSTGVALVHIMLANDIDHISIVGIGSQISIFNKYRNLHALLTAQAKHELDKIIPQDLNLKDSATFIRFIAHSGVQIADKTISVVVDPWLYDSKRDSPIIEGLDPTQRTIDYLIPEPKNTAQELAPDIICLSHFHTHHSPLKEIIEFAKIKDITVICPPLDKNKLHLLQAKIGDYIFGKITFKFVENDQEITIKNVTIQAMVHKVDMVHLLFTIKLNTKSITHIVDASAGNDFSSLSFSQHWDKLYGTRPDFLFIGAAGHLLKKIEHGERMIEEASTLTPIQAAQLASKIMPREVGIIGIYNHSVWDDRYEMAFGTQEAESQFYWGLSYLAPSIKIRKLLPGDIL